MILQPLNFIAEKDNAVIKEPSFLSLLYVVTPNFDF